MAKYQVGDEVTVRGVVTGQIIDGAPIVEFKRHNDFHCTVSFATPLEEIATHMPKPREFKPGDRVLVAVTQGLGVMRVVAIDDNTAWLKDSDDIRWTFTVDKLWHADEAD